MEKVKIFKYLKPRSYYNDLYDGFTIEECRRFEKHKISEKKKEIKKKNTKDKIKKGFKVNIVSLTALYFIKGERYCEKTKTIKDWMERDKTHDEKIENAIAPKDILCSSCSSEMTTRMKDLQDDYRDKKEKVLFFFDCPRCNKRRLIFEDGIEWKCPPTLCKKCKSIMDKNNERKGRKIITIYKCPRCNHKEEDTWDLDEKAKPEKTDPNFKKDRKRFCLSEEEGMEYIAAKNKLKAFSEEMKKINEKAKIEKEISKIKKLNIAQLKNLLTKGLEKEYYIKLELSNPEMNRNIIVNFTIQDNEQDRGEYDSRTQLQRIIKEKLEGTNWRLMSEGINYRLGILSGRLKAYDNEEDLLRLLKK